MAQRRLVIIDSLPEPKAPGREPDEPMATWVAAVKESVGQGQRAEGEIILPRVRPALREKGDCDMSPTQKVALSLRHNGAEIRIKTLMLTKLKTPITIALFHEAKKRGLKGSGLAVVKSSLKIQWASETKKFSDYEPRIIKTPSECCAQETAKLRRLEKKAASLLISKEEKKILEQEIALVKEEARGKFAAQFKGADFLIVNYETLRDKYVLAILHKEVKPQFIMLDEIHLIKAASAKRSQAACEFNDAEYRFGASATPIQQGPRDIYGIFKFIAPSEFPSARKFDQLYIKFGMGHRPIGAINQKTLNKHIAPYTIIKTKEEVSSQLPKLVVSQRYCDLEPKQKEMNAQIMEKLEELHEKEKKLMGNLSEHEAKSNSELQQVEAAILMHQTFAQELCDSEKLLSLSDSKTAKNFVTGENDNKLDLLMELMEEILESGEKLVVFSRYRRMQPIIAERIRKEAAKAGGIFSDINIAYAHGGLSDEQRHEEIYGKFEQGDCRILLATNAIAEGVNLSSCGYLIEYDRAESYAIQTQRHGRIERADSTHNTVHVYQLHCRGSWDDVAARIVEKKEGYDLEIVKGQSFNESSDE
mgnify:CR=1 FL=1